MDLFPKIEESLSPFLMFRQKYNIHVRYENNDEGLMPYTASIGPLEKVKDENNVGFGCTEREAVLALARRLDLFGWREMNWDER